MNKKIAIVAGLALLISWVLIFTIGQNKKPAKGKRGITEVESLYNAASAAQADGELGESVKLHEELIEQFPRDEKAADSLYKLGQIYESEDTAEKARGAYAKIIANFPNFKHISEVEKRLWDLNVKILFSPVVSKKDVIYKVEAGDTLGRIAAKYNTTVDLIMRSNNLENHLIRPGKRLKISTAKYSVIVDKSQNTLTLKQDNEIFKVYPVATGKHNCTPTGNHRVVEKLKDPDWYKKGEGIVPAGNPENILGTRWIGLSEPQYGIHGGATAGDLEKQVTNGCIRMRNPAVEELFTILPRGSEIIIVD